MPYCVNCGEEYEISLRFGIMIKNTFNPNPEAEQFENCDSVCPDCIATWFTETPEDIEYMTIYRRDVRNGFRMSIM